MTNPVVNLSAFAGAGAQFFDNNGVPLSGGLLYTYAAGTTTPQATYTTPVGNITNSNPIVLDSSGRTPQEIWLLNGYTYKFVLQTATATQIGSYDNIPGQSSNVAIINDANSVAYEQGSTTTAGSFIVGKTYQITTIGTTNFTAIGASSNTVGTYFTATGVGTGTGTGQFSRSVQAKLQETVSVEDFGAKCDGTTDDSASFQLALNYSASTGIALTWVGNMAIRNSVTTSAALNIVGKGVNNTILTCFNSSGLSVTGTTGNGTLMQLTIQDGNDQSAWVATPLVQIASAFEYLIEQVYVYGVNKRRYGLRIGIGGVAYGSSFICNHFAYCQIGVQISDIADATHIFFANNTCDHNKVAGAVFCNPIGGEIVGNSFENNEGYYGLCILSGANGSSIPSSNVSIRGNYIFNNGANYATSASTCGVMMGGNVIGSDFVTAGTYTLTSSQAVQEVILENNYIVSNYYYNSFQINAFRTNYITSNLCYAGQTGSSEGALTGLPGSTIISGNTNQNTGNPIVVTTPSGYSYLIPLTVSNSVNNISLNTNSTISIGTVAELTQSELLLGQNTSGNNTRTQLANVSVTGSGGTYTTIFDTTTYFGALGTDAGIAQLLISVDQTNQANKSVHMLMVNSALNGNPATYQSLYTSPSSAVDGTAFQMTGGGQLQLYRTNGWQAVITVTASGFPFA